MVTNMLKTFQTKRSLFVLIKSVFSIAKKQFNSFAHVVAQALRRTSLSSELVGPPKGYFQSALEWEKALLDRQNESNAPHYVEICPQQVIRRKEPKTIDNILHQNFRDQLEFTSPSTYVATLSNGRIWGNSRHCAVITPDDKVLADVSRDFGKSPENYSVFGNLSLGSLYPVKGTAVSLVAAGGESFYHWFYHVLPRIGMVQESGIDLETVDKVIVNGLRFQFHKESLAALGIPEAKIIETRKHHHIKADQLIVPSFPQVGANVTPWVCDFFKSAFLKFTQKDASKSRRIYVSRQKALQRRIINEVEVSKCLNNLGFEEVFLEDLPFLEQISLFASADVVFAPHGAGLSHLVFCSPSTKVIELFSKNYVGTTFWLLSAAMNLDYYYLICDSQKPSGYLGQHPKYEDVIVDIDQLQSIMRMASLM